MAATVPALQMIDSIGALEELLNELDHKSHESRSLFFDVNVINPGPDASISIISIFIRPIRKVFLIDVVKLGDDAFNTTSLADNSLKLIFESTAVAKILFDVGNASAALFNRHGIRLNGIKDLQVMELATKHQHGQERVQVASLEMCVEQDAHPPAKALELWKRVHNSVNQLRDPANGRSEAVFNERPLRPEILNYHFQNVVILPRLWVLYNDTLRRPNSAFWRSMIFPTVRDRIRESTNGANAGGANATAWGWSREFVESSKRGWNEDILLELQGIPMVDRCWIDPNFF
ncbi:hypothetical protein CNMCM5793_000991 [Aspergillus hiratsukae]|uniref:3'-5' exonuclease domain-containing protein n=1 Tax=Aspergillus hiratsukae TaxID=1194566 RepID=A0A8H6PAG9_9EURO|nr:hypothetical protein CNMCM5793_000991 [Aspergillus hiratsukae]KAF7156995.1 hypothetical protein CNMCM6106_001774 [Aspergillus hiratsukae]